MKKIHKNIFVDKEHDDWVGRELVRVKRLAPETSEASIYRKVICAGVETLKSKKKPKKKK